MSIKRSSIPIFALILLCSAGILSFQLPDQNYTYTSYYEYSIRNFIRSQEELIQNIKNEQSFDKSAREKLYSQIGKQRLLMKSLDFWLRYLEPTIYKKINGPLPVEWETEVFEKFEKPYRREGAGHLLAIQYLEEDGTQQDSLLHLMDASLKASRIYLEDSIREKMKDPGHFYFCNRLFLLNLSTLYTTGFECPDTAAILPELNKALTAANNIYDSYKVSFPDYSLSHTYRTLFDSLRLFVQSQQKTYNSFDHYRFVRNYVNPLFSLNQELIRTYKFRSRNVVDYSLNYEARSIFSKNLYSAQNTKGIYRRIQDPEVLEDIRSLGKSLFYDPLLSVNNQRTCASCHKSAQAFTDTSTDRHIQLDRMNKLQRNTPSLVNSIYNHLIMQDGSILSLQDQVRAVVSNSLEMGAEPEEVLKKVLSCRDYKKSLERIRKQVPEEGDLRFEHLSSAITFYYGQFSSSIAYFDKAMNRQAELDEESRKGFNLFMGKAQCATCHFLPHFNGVKPPYVGSEFEVLGVPSDSSFREPDADAGRFGVNPAPETFRAFRTGSLRNITKSAPYMHNGLYKNLEEVIDFYNAGGGAGRGLNIDNQSLSSDSLHLSATEKKQLIRFMTSLNEDILSEVPPQNLPLSKHKILNTRVAGGTY